MTHLKPKVNKTQTIKELKIIADKRYAESWQPELQEDAFIDGAEALFKLLRISDVSQRSVLLSDLEKWLNRKENKSYYSFPVGYVIERFKSLNCG